MSNCACLPFHQAATLFLWMHAGKVAKIQVAASQIDWRVLQQGHTERWLKCVQRAFQGARSRSEHEARAACCYLAELFVES